MKTALIIDDDPVIGTLLARTLETAGWRVIRADSGDEGISIALEQRPQLVLCDLLMPRSNGFNVFRALRNSEQLFPPPRLIAISSSHYEADRDNAFGAGADDFLLKPVHPAELLRVIREAPGTTITPKPDARDTPIPPEPAPTLRNLGRPPTVRFWGVRGSIATPGPTTMHYGGNTSCIEVRADGELIILDAGTGIRQLGRKLEAEFADRPLKLTILISHTHWDHIQGFPFFIPAYNPRNQIRLFGYEGARLGLQSVLSNQMESPYFPISLQQMTGHLQVEELSDLDFNLGEVRVRATFLNHPGVCVGYRLETSGGSVAYLPDNEPYFRLRLAPGSGAAPSSEVLAYAQQQDEKLISFIRDADVLIMDSQYDAEEYQKHIGWGHGCVDDVAALAALAGVKRLFLFHHDPDHDDAHVTRMTGRAREVVSAHGGSVEVEAAREGLEVTVARAVAKDGA